MRLGVESIRKILGRSAVLGLAAALASIPCTARAQVPAKVGYQGRLMTASGEPEMGVVTMTFTLLDAETNGNVVWGPESHEVGLNEGFYNVFLGEVMALDSRVFNGRELFLELSVEGQPLTPRQRLASVPYALACTSAQSIAGGTGTVNAGSVQVGGITVIDSTGRLTEAALPMHTHSATTITSGVLDPSVVPTGTDDTKLPLAGGTMTGAINMGGRAITNAAAPVAPNDVATKAYVDAADGTTSRGGGGACYYTNAFNCLPGYVLAPGIFQNANLNHSICCPDPSESGPAGAFVLTQTTYNGNLGGLAGADARCLMELQTRDWLGKSKYTLSAANVRAFLCDSATCRNLAANKSYAFATAGNIDFGGGTFGTDAFGRGPNDSIGWTQAAQFGVNAGYWTNRRTVTSTRWSTGPQETSTTATCNNWTETAGTGVYGVAGPNDQLRWRDTNNGPSGCGAVQHLICIVD
jgi:hypothetical protein